MRRRWLLPVLMLLIIAGAWWFRPEPVTVEEEASPPVKAQPRARPGRGELKSAPEPVEEPVEAHRSIPSGHLDWLADRGFVLVHCALSEPVEEAQGAGPQGGWWAEGAELVFALGEPGPGTQKVVIPGYVPVEASWDAEGRCSPELIQLEPGAAVVEGRVEDADGRPVPGARVGGCGNNARADGEGRFRGEFLPEDCELTARSGQLEGDPVALRPVLGEVVEVVLGLPEAVRVEGRVRNTAGNPEPEAFISGCGVRVMSDAEGRFTVLIEGWPCELTATRADGLLRSGDSVELAGEPGELLQVELVLPEYPKAGLGLSFQMGPEGAEVVRLIPGGAAEQAGLVEGMVIVALDGEPTAGMSSEDFVEAATGDDGTEVELTLDDGSRLVLERQPVGG